MAKTYGYKILFCLLGCTAIFLSDFTCAKPLQILMDKPGYISVFIRHGDEPLADIDPGLAEAFHEERPQNGVVPIDHQDLSSVEVAAIYDKLQNSLGTINEKKDNSTHSVVQSL